MAAVRAWKQGSNVVRRGAIRGHQEVMSSRARDMKPFNERRGGATVRAAAKRIGFVRCEAVSVCRGVCCCGQAQLITRVRTASAALALSLIRWAPQRREGVERVAHRLQEARMRLVHLTAAQLQPPTLQGW